MYGQPTRSAAPALSPRVCVRWASTATKRQVRSGRKGHLYGPQPTASTTTPEEEVRITKRRIAKAERDERMDITLALTPVKTYMGGFTRPRDLRSSNWFPGGAYAEKGKVYESPPESAYESHTVFLLESRYPIKHGIGRVDSVDHVVGVCREGDLEAVLQRYNSERAPYEELEGMDNARWPWQPQKTLKRTKWWADGENPREIIKEIFGEDTAYADQAVEFEEFEDDVEETIPGENAKNVSKTKAGSTPVTLLAKASTSSLTSEQKRTLFTSAANHGAHSYNEDHIVPDFYVQHKRRKNSDAEHDTPPRNDLDARVSKKRQSEAITESLMENLSDSILSDEVTASTMRRSKSKIPHEHYNEEGILVHPSGFVIPTPGEAEIPMSEKRLRNLTLQTAAVAERVLEEGDYTDINAHTRLQDGKVPFEILEADGTVTHPSGFVPPTAQHHFKYSDSSSVDNHVQDAVQRQKRLANQVHLTAEETEERQRKSDALFARDEDDAELIAELKAGIQEATRKLDANQKRGIHTSAIARAWEVPFGGHRSAPPHLPNVPSAPTSTPKPKLPAKENTVATQELKVLPVETKEIRAQYMPTLAEKPFWRPLLTVTVATRPLAVTLARLARAHERGLPFYASISNDDRKTLKSYPDRMRCMRINRMSDLTVRTAELLAGARGGFVGIRFATHHRGRGIYGEGLDAPLEKDKRTIKIGVGNWYTRADEVKDAFKEDAATRVGQVGVGLDDIGETFEIAGLDDHGRLIDDVTGDVIPWHAAKPFANLELLDEYNEQLSGKEEDADADADAPPIPENQKRREFKLKRQALARDHKHELALSMSQKHRSVQAP